MRESLLKLRKINDNGIILIGVKSIIKVRRAGSCTEISTLGGICWVEETPDEIFNQYKTHDTQRQTTS